MKKLMVVAAIALAALASQAAEVKWTTAALYSPDATGAFTETLVKNDAKLGSILATITFFDNSGTQVATQDSSAFAKAGGLTATTSTDDLFKDGSTYDYTVAYSLMYDGKQYTMDGAGSFTVNKGTGNFNLAANTGSAWTPQSIPEPTSGLLLLLGVAGLALRRRRA